MPKKQTNNAKKTEMNKCPQCNYHVKTSDLPAHIRFQHEKKNAGVITSVDKNRKAKVYYCTECGPLPREFRSQAGLDEHKRAKNH